MANRLLIEDRLGERAQVYGGERAILVGLELSRGQGDGWAADVDAGADTADSGSFQESMEELVALSETAGVVVKGTLIQRRSKPDPAYFLGEGKVEQLRELAELAGADTIIFNDALTPAQSRNLEERLQRKIIDRPQLIMSIFAQHARTKEAKLQVELAQLEYLLPRLRGWGRALSQLGGGIGTRGPGETQMERERRKIKRRIHTIREQLRKAELERQIKRKLRRRQGLPTVALIGYTNTGKSTLLNRLSGAKAKVEDKLFATLDPLVRRAPLPGGQEILLVDTVGFIKKLPPQLIPAFLSTLEAVREADLLLNVLDISSPWVFDHFQTVSRVLGELFSEGEGARPKMVTVLNKVDRLQGEDERGRARLERALRELPSAVAVSALEGTNIDKLLELIAAELEAARERLQLEIPYTKGYLLDELHRHGEVHREEYRPEGVLVEATVERSFAEGLRQALELKVETGTPAPAPASPGRARRGPPPARTRPA